MKRNLGLLVLMLLVGTGLLIREAANTPLWQDEGWSLYLAHQSSLAEVVNAYQDDIHPPLHGFLLHGWLKLTGIHPFAPRVMGLWCVLLTAAITYRFALDLFNPRAAFAAAVIVLTSD